MNCDQARTEIIAYLKGELGTEAKQRLEEHLARCPNCRHELDGARRLLSWTEAASQEAVVKTVEETIDGAIAAGASDIHWEPQRDNTLQVRYRVDGVLHVVATHDSVMRQGIVSRVKMLADMNMSETSTPQDGRIPWKLHDQPKEYDIRVASSPFIFGEGFVMRILDRSSVLVGLDRLGFYPDHMKSLTEIASQPNGLLVIGGPTGSGKTTTIYSLLMHLISPERKVLTIEDPVEYQIPGANQVQVHKKVGLTFAAGLRSFLRHDPDIIYLGEMRDLETAMIAVEAAITGHLVITSLHTNDAVSSFVRLVDMGVEPYLIAATMIGAVNQRLARKVCANCKEEAELDLTGPVARFLGITAEDLADHKIYRGNGCEVCRGTGYKGRTGVYEILRVTKDLASMIIDRPPLRELKDAATAGGFAPMREDAKRKVLDGITTPEEVFRILV